VSAPDPVLRYNVDVPPPTHPAGVERNAAAEDQVVVMEPAATNVVVSIDPLIRRHPADEGALSALYRRHSRRLVGLARAVTLDDAAATDVVHDAFAGLAPRLDEVRDPVAYLQRSVVNLGIRVVRRRERARAVPARPIQHASIPEVDELWTGVRALPAQQRAVVVLRFWEDLSHERIADVLGIPVGTVKSTLHRALKTIRERM
jgi:RNA polymerase sigma factor (sigma-70 family)